MSVDKPIIYVIKIIFKKLHDFSQNMVGLLLRSLIIDFILTCLRKNGIDGN